VGALIASEMLVRHGLGRERDVDAHVL